MSDHPVQITVEDDLHRSRLTVFFRLLFAIPHLVWFALWTVPALVAAILNWFAVLFTTRTPRPFHRFLTAYIRYVTQVGAFLWLAANPFPGFVGDPAYPVTVEIAEPQPQRRLVTLFKLVLVLPALVISAFLSGGLSFGGGGIDLAAVAALLGWFAALILARMPSGLRDLVIWSLGYGAQLSAYLFSLTDRYPTSDPNAHVDSDVPEHAVRLELDDDSRRSRLTVLFRLLLAIPHLAWLYLWGIGIQFAMIAAWFVALFTGRLPESLHNFMASYVTYAAHVYAYLALVTNPFPGFMGERGYPFEIVIAAPVRQNRLVTFFRLVLALPAFVIAALLSYLLVVMAILGWFAALATGRMPLGFRNSGAATIRYVTQVHAYVLLLTPQYAHSSPVLPRPKPEPEAHDEPLLPPLPPAPEPEAAA